MSKRPTERQLQLRIPIDVLQDRDWFMCGCPGCRWIWIMPDGLDSDSFVCPACAGDGVAISLANLGPGAELLPRLRRILEFQVAPVFERGLKKPRGRG